MPITMSCDCGKQLTVSDGMAGRKGKCPRCGAALVVPDPTGTAGSGVSTSTSIAPPSWGRLNGLPLVLGSMLVVMMVISAWEAYVALSLKNSLEEALSTAVTAETLKREAEGMKLREETKLHTLYPNLHRLEPGKNIVGERYIESFTFADFNIRVKLVNTSNREISPGFYLNFMNKEGFITSTVRIHWMISTIKPEETHIEEQRVIHSFGEPVYFSVQFE